MIRLGHRQLRRFMLAALCLLAWTLTAQSAEGQFKCFPSCDATDGRFLVIATGAGLVTLSDTILDVQLAAPADSSSFQVGFFDGDSGGIDGLSLAHWDFGAPTTYTYTLYADPLGDGTGTTMVEMSPGFPSISSLTLADNDWTDFTVATSPEALSPSGNYLYRLHIELTGDMTLPSYNSFKIRSSGISTIRLEDQPFSYMAPLGSFEDLQIIYPDFPSFTPTTYDGTFRFFFSIPDAQSDITVWNGDFDRGKWDGTDLDMDDPDTPNAPFLPAWATDDAVSEGVATNGFPLNTTGNPADDTDSPFFLREPSVRSELHFPDGQVFPDENPSGNQEWEQFRVSTEPFDPSLMDATTTSVPGGTYEYRVLGVDMGNLNAIRLPDRALCVSEAFEPCSPLYPFLVGDTVFRDLDGDGVQAGAGETGIADIVIELLSMSGNVIATTVTDANGEYSFNVPAGTYTVQVADSNSDPGGPLDGAIATTPVQLTETVVDDNVLTYDFGYRGTGSVGDRVWLDTNGDGVQDTGENGIDGVTVELLDGDGNVLASTTTAGDGGYLFDRLFSGSYSVRVVASTLPEGLEATYDLDGNGTPHVAAVTLGAGENQTEADFGYRGTASVGDRVWNDLDGNGTQDGGEAGLNGVTVELLDGGGNVVATTTTAGDGDYTFSNLTPGTYSVRVVSSTLPAGLVPTYDLDSTGTPHIATVQLGAGEDRADVDFGYRTPPCAPGTFEDRFSTASFSNNDGSLSWSGPWIEDDVAGAGVSSGNVAVGTPVSGYMILRDSPDTGTQPSAAREANLAGFVSATLMVDFHIRGVEADDAVVVEVSGNGGASYTVLETLTGYTGTYDSSRTFDISAFISANTRVRFRVSNNYGGGDDFFKVDEVRIDGSCAPSQNGSIGDRLWYDADGDGHQDSGEPGLGGTTVELLNSGGTVIASTTTNGSGLYSFNDLAAGSYTVRVVASTLPAGGLAPTYDLDGTGTPHTTAVPLDSGQTRSDVDFGYRGTRSLGDRVWKDLDGDGLQETGEPGINGVTVRLFLGSTQLASTVTSGDGNYTFDDLPDLTYTVKTDSSTLPAGATPTYDLDGLATPHQATVNVTASRTDVDFGYRITVSCTAGYFKDHFSNASFSNNDGTLSWSGSWIESDTAGAGVSSGNVTVGSPYSGYLFLRDSPDTGTQPSAARQADLSGFSSATLSFSFHVRTGVDPDDAVTIEISKNGGSTWTVLETLDGYSGSAQDSRSYDISAYIASNTRIRFRVSNNYGVSDELFKLDWVKIDAGCSGTPPPSADAAGNRVWKDLDGDGAQDSGEPGLNGVTVQLLNSSGTVIATTTTSGDGNYTFSGLAGATYKVKVVSSTVPSGLAPSYDLDGTGTAHVATFTLTSGQSRTDIDFGYRPFTCTAGYFKDHFSSASFSNDNGTLSWAGSWIESDSAGTGVSSGNVTVGSPYSGYLFLRDSPNTGTQPSAARQVNLSGFASATLSFSFHVRTGVDPDDAVTVEVSNNGGTSYTTLETLSGFTGTYTGSRSYNISAYKASNTRIRFRVSNNYGASDELFKLDWVKIDAACQ